MVKIVAVNISEKKGTIKKPVKEILLTDKGIEKDAHSGNWHRQVSLLASESIQKQRDLAGREISPGEFAENITTEGMEIHKATQLSHFENEELCLQVTQIGKKCHGSSCAIFRESGDCVMPREGVSTMRTSKYVRCRDSLAGFLGASFVTIFARIDMKGKNIIVLVTLNPV